MCRNKSIAPRGVEVNCHKDPDLLPHPGLQLHHLGNPVQNNFSILTYMVLGGFITAAIGLFLSTIYYRKKFRKMQGKNSQRSTSIQPQKKKVRIQRKNKNFCKNANDENVKTTSRKWLASSYKDQNVNDMEYILQHTVLECGEVDAFGDRYDEHGVKIETDREEDTDMMQHYFK